MNKKYILLFTTLLLLLYSCDPNATGSVEGNTPKIPKPASYTDILPAVSEEITVATSGMLSIFQIPSVFEVTTDDGTITVYPMFTPFNTLYYIEDSLVDDGVLLDELNIYKSGGIRYSIPNPISSAPRIVHTRYWKNIKEDHLGAGDATHTMEYSYTTGRSTTDSVSEEFSTTLGVSATVSGGWGAVSASVTSSYEETNTSTTVSSVTFETEDTVTDTRELSSLEDEDVVYVYWQLIDVFEIVDDQGVSIDESDTINSQIIMPEMHRIEFPNDSVFMLDSTKFEVSN